MDFVFVYVTAPSLDEARRIGRALVDERLAACVNIIDGMSSMFWWEGKIDEARETVLIAKTRASRVRAIVARVKKMHSYSCPCVVALKVEEGNPRFLEWIAKETDRAAENTTEKTPGKTTGKMIRKAARKKRKTARPTSSATPGVRTRAR
ncbi:MAG: divalent-cation tolerance protein CutA [Alphaproteobacteria bacterium]